MQCCVRTARESLLAWPHLHDVLPLGPFLKFQASVSNTRLIPATGDSSSEYPIPLAWEGNGWFWQKHKDKGTMSSF